MKLNILYKLISSFVKLLFIWNKNACDVIRTKLLKVEKIEKVFMQQWMITTNDHDDYNKGLKILEQMYVLRFMR